MSHITAIYDNIGNNYATNRATDARWQKKIHDALAGVRTVVNVGAGSGSYESNFSELIAVEPSATMIQQRPVGSAPVVQAVAEKLPFSNKQFEAALAILSTHHWSDAKAGLMELQRVASKQVVITWDPDCFAAKFWLVRDYLPQVYERERNLATVRSVEANLNVVKMEPLMVPLDCKDGFLGAHWKQPNAYLNPAVRASMSGLALLDRSELEAATEKLAADLASGAWAQRNQELEILTSIDLGYRLVVCAAS